MATQTATFPATAPSSAGVLLPAFTLWWREIVRFYRQRARVVGVIVSPLLFWVVIGSGFGTSFRSGQAAGQQHYLNYFYPGTLVMIVLFTAIFTMMSVIEDRNEGFLLSVLVAPVPRAAIVLGKVLGGTTLATAQGLIFLVFAPFVGVHMTLASFVPLWLLSGALFPLSGASGWIRWLMYANPLTYGVEALRTLMYPEAPSAFSLTASILTLVLFALFMFGLAFALANRRTTKPAA